MRYFKTRLGQGARVVIPAEHRKALCWQEGERLVIQLAEGEVRIFSLREHIRRTQDWARRYFPPDRSLVDELIAERRAEAARE